MQPVLTLAEKKSCKGTLGVMFNACETILWDKLNCGGCDE